LISAIRDNFRWWPKRRTGFQPISISKNQRQASRLLFCARQGIFVGEGFIQETAGNQMYFVFLIIGALACLPEIDIAYASLELHAWLLIGISLGGIVSYGLYIYKKKWPLILPHLFISASYVLVFYVLTLLFPFYGPSGDIYNHYANKLFTKLQSDFLEKDSLPAIEQLTFMLSRDSDDLRSSAAGYLATIADKLRTPEQKKLFSDYAIPALGKALHDPSPFVRREAAAALLNSGDLAIDVLPDLMSRVLNNDDTASFSIEAIGNLGPKAKEAVPVLLPLLHFNYPETGFNGGIIRKDAVEALGKISTDTNVIKAIQQALNDPDDDVRKAAEEVLKKYNQKEKP
jgi:hypothetical protein